MIHLKRSIFGLIAASVVFFVWLDHEQSQFERGESISYAEAGHTAPDFTLQTFNGDDFTLQENIDEDGAVIYFWTSWCPYCRASSEAVQEAHEQYGDRVTLIGVNASHQDSIADAEDFIDRHGLEFTQLIDEGGSVSSSYYVPPVPATVFINSDGDITYRKTGAISSTELRNEISNLTEGGR